MTTDLVLATGNVGKAREFEALFGETFAIAPQSAFGVVPPEETGLTYVENALLKARVATAAARRPAIADDSGLEVDALGGAPGLYSARYAGVGASDQTNLEHLLRALAGRPAPRTARFRCVLVYLRHPDDPAPLIAEGVWEGSILEAPRGTSGFGYDPIFWVPDLGASAAELAPAVKNAHSHRGQAIARMRSLLSAGASPAPR